MLNFTFRSLTFQMVSSDLCYEDSSVIQLRSMQRQYYEELQHLIDTSFTHPCFKCTPSGSGFDLWPALENYKSSPEYSFIFTHKISVLLRDRNVEYVKDIPLLFYIEEGTNSGTLRLNIAARTESHLLRYNYGMRFDGKDIIIRSEDGEFKMLLSTKVFSDEFNRSKWLYTFLSRKSMEQNFVGDGTLDEEAVTYAVPRCGFVTKEWPFHEYKNRHRPSNWPSEALVSSVLDEECIILPARTEDHTEWKYNFNNMYVMLNKNFSNEMIQLANLLKQIHHQKLHKVPWSILKSVFYLFIERFTLVSIQADIKVILRELINFLKDQFVPDYFLNNSNLLVFLKSCDIDEMLQEVESCNLDSIFTQINVTISNVVLSQYKAHYLQEYCDNFILIYICAYTRLHQNFKEKALRKNKALQKVLNKSITTEMVPMQFNEFMSINEAMLYLCFYCVEQCPQTKNYYEMKARETLGKSGSSDYYQINKLVLHSCLKEYDEAIRTCVYFPDMKETHHKNDFKSELQEFMRPKVALLPFISSNTLNQCFFSRFVEKSLALSPCQTLGIENTLVSVMPATFMMHFMKIYCSSKSAAKHEFDSEKSLVIMDEIMQKQNNELRMLACLNILAESYGLIGQEEKMMETLRKSSTLYSTLKNPARTRLMGFKLARLMEQVKQLSKKVFIFGILPLLVGVTIKYIWF